MAVRLEGLVSPNPETGRLEISFLKNPQLTFSRFVLKSKGGQTAPLANPLVCGSAPAQSLFTPYTGLAAATPSGTFVTAAARRSLPFALSQSAPAAPATAGAHGSTSYTLNLARAAASSTSRRSGRCCPPVSWARYPTSRSAANRRRAGHVPSGKPDRHGDRERRGGPRPVHVHRPRVHDGPIRGRALRPVGRGAGRRRAVQPRHGRHPRHDQRRNCTAAASSPRARCPEDRRWRAAAPAEHQRGP